MRFWLSITFVPTPTLPGILVAAEAAGFDGVAIGEHLVVLDAVATRYPYSASGDPTMRPDSHFPDPLVLAGLLGGLTTRLSLMTSVYVVPLRPVLVVAKAVSTAAVLCGGRLVFGIGTGWLREEFEAAGQDFATRGRRTDEMLEVIGQLLTGAPVEHHGRFVDLAPVTMSPVPERPVPVLVGGHSDAALARAAAHDGWIGLPTTLDHLVGLLDALRAARAARSSVGPFAVVVSAAGMAASADYGALAELGVTDVIVPTHEGLGSRRAPLADQRATMAAFVDSVSTWRTGG
ncbi:MAG TPA: TIGR03619 family F420-dependent LLM class oxidoreductase [Acidimicrobiales bacterium]|nr:TIGR03619 family F420-dependent LLM class oxidoreductase [Acidimicrobiales bacterium]